MLRAVLTSAALLFCSWTAHADEVWLVASNAVKELGQELIPHFEKATGHLVVVTWGGTPDITRLAEEAGDFDLVVIPQGVVADLQKRGKLLAGASRDFVASAIGAATSPGARKFDDAIRLAELSC